MHDTTHENAHEKHARSLHKNIYKTPGKYTIPPNKDAYKKHARPLHKNAETTSQS
ncbi:hypothetical protein C2G38_2186295 [Gigaspora rosea]|uniref:Uncharacterized protein n=1 Tax=Gigaspora rosea TaxID=44941 RepID=A0A397V5I6_9GLOM|nr:hypothetical protein C2G38_2186295 [Gigaspora rosea]